MRSMHWFKRFCAVLILIPTATCIFGGFTKEILQGLHILPRLNKTCISPFADDSINIIQIVEDVVKGFLGKCPYRPGSESVASQLSDYVNFYVLARDGLTYQKTAVENVPSVVKPAERTYILVHGYIDEVKLNSNGWMMKTGVQLFKNRPSNVILLDYGSLSKCSYVYLAGIVVADLGHYLSKSILQWGLNLKRTELIGFSLGAHISGVAGYDLGGQLARITGLDPAGPMFSSDSPSIKQNGLNTSCAAYVEVLHTAAIVGIQERIGHADFYANRNSTQPGCNSYDMPCNHGRANEIFYASCFPEYKFIGSTCAECEPNGISRFGYFNIKQKYGCFVFNSTACFGYALNETKSIAYSDLEIIQL